MDTTNYFELFGLKSPYDRFKNKPDLVEVMRGWTGTHPFLSEIVEKVSPSTIIELGSYLGQSAITMANATKKLGITSKIICVDTWLGSAEHWRNDKCNDLKYFQHFENGTSVMYDQFVINMIVNKVDDIIVPIPNTTRQAFDILQWKNISADLIYVDASHEMMDVYDDIMMYSKLLRKGGFLFGDDYRSWEAVRKGAHMAEEKLGGKLKVYHNHFWAISLP
jgi:hypothetical protein